MAAAVYYAQDGSKVEPVSVDEIILRMREAGDRPFYVWTEGMSEWRDARELEEFSDVFQAPEPRPEPAAKAASAAHETLAKRARHEMIAYMAVSGYLFVWFSAVMFYKATILRSVGVDFAPFGLAAVKALILGKFILVLEALKIGERGDGRGVFILQVFKSAFLFTLLLIVLSIIEEVVVGYFHGRAASDALREMGGGTIPQAIATGVLMFLVLVPYLAFRRLAKTFGDLPELLFMRPATDKGDVKRPSGR